ncbi:MAG: 2,3-bisphosphoglycerate-independent phosphoglycerate mutase [Patescibacteria group bacterium]
MTSAAATEKQQPRPAVLIILDGWGVAPDSDGNAIRRAKTPILDDLVRRYPAMTVRSSGEEVGLSWGEMGNSEVGHLAIGAGRVYYQMLPRIDHAIQQESFFTNTAFLDAIQHVKKNGNKLHFIGLVSGGRVHAMDTHLHALLDLAKKQKVKDVFVHAILDGRDTLYNAGHDFISTLIEKMKKVKLGKIASLSGRFYAMDRDNRWDRIEQAYNAMALGTAPQTTENPLEALKASYAKEVYDEQFVPTVITEGGTPVTKIEKGDAVIFFNFRPDRSRELTKAFVMPEFEKFSRTYVEDLFFVTMAEYEAGLPVEIAFPPQVIDHTIAEVLSGEKMRQLHVAETEKYAHVTFFLNGTQETPFPGEDRVIIPSPRVSSYDEAPEMSAYEITDRVLKEIRKGAYDFIALNFANGDMVGHTGNMEATIKAVEVVDECIGKIVSATIDAGGAVFITADHGNAEEVKNLQTNDIDKEHSTNPVPFLIVSAAFEGQSSPAGEAPGGDLSLLSPVGMLADVAPTILKVLGIEQPPEMTGTPLI